MSDFDIYTPIVIAIIAGIIALFAFGLDYISKGKP